jgi:anti-sigma28 factor (negative regulator of flagellin synthesis)
MLYGICCEQEDETNMRLQLDSPLGPGEAGSAGGLQPAAGTDAASNSGAAAAGSIRNSGQSGDRTLISGAANLLAASAAERATRIEQLSAAVQTGNYAPSSSAISRAIVSQALP